MILMPMAPPSNIPLGASGPSLLDAVQQPSNSNLLMAAAIHASQGRKMSQPNPSKPHPPTKKLKVLK